MMLPSELELGDLQINVYSVYEVGLAVNLTAKATSIFIHCQCRGCMFLTTVAANWGDTCCVLCFAAA